jgi:dCTP deaminase
MLLSDLTIIKLCKEEQLLTPFVETSMKEVNAKDLIKPDAERLKKFSKGPSYGPSSYGYDIRLDNEFKVFKNDVQMMDGIPVIDPMNFSETAFDCRRGDQIIMPPHSFILGVSKEYFKMPRNVTGLVMNKSTYARCGVDCFTTVIEAGWEGQLVLEFANTTNRHVVLHANMGIAQILFIRSEDECETSYSDRGGKYQGQTGVQTAICK